MKGLSKAQLSDDAIKYLSEETIKYVAQREKERRRKRKRAPHEEETSYLLQEQDLAEDDLDGPNLFTQWFSNYAYLSGRG